ncbi:MAG TPA: class I SAM-dependent methyltransferase [Acidimicrobiales bacterium]|nr:class I SAM-dependent methyltransferase [Acidimicrobiales bacterium]
MANLDGDRLASAFRKLGDMATAAHVAGMVALGIRTGLYRAMDGLGWTTSEELAHRAGLSERWVREWLYGQAAAGVVEHEDGERFSLAPEIAALVVDERSLFYMGGNFTSLPNRMSLVPKIEEAFRTGIGLSYDDRGPEAAADTELIFGNWYRQMLVPVGLPALGDDVVARLANGGRVADVGCGAGVALVELAKAFPGADLHGYDTSRHALARAEANKAEAGVANVHFHAADSDPLPGDASFDLVTTFDCLHDMTHPEVVVAAIRRAVKPDGVWLIADIACGPTFAEYVAKRPAFASMTYAMSVYSCMSSSLSEPGGAGLGTCGLPEPAMRELVTAGGFGHFRSLPIEHPVNAFYEARP